jgi:hypothetical protein
MFLRPLPVSCKYFGMILTYDQESRGMLHVSFQCVAGRSDASVKRLVKVMGLRLCALRYLGSFILPQ